jgi:predicted acyl esterase
MVTEGSNGRFFKARNQLDQQEPRRTKESRRRLVQHSTDREPGIRKNPRFTNRSGLGNPDRRVNRPDMLRKEEEPLREQEQVKKHVMMVG